jgi:hypothetical protein
MGMNTLLDEYLARAFRLSSAYAIFTTLNTLSSSSDQKTHTHISKPSLCITSL